MKGEMGEIDMEKQSGEFSPKMSEESSPMSPTNGTFPTNGPAPQRTASRGKLQKVQPRADGTTGSPVLSQQPGAELGPQRQTSSQDISPVEPLMVNGVSATQPSMRMVQSDEDMQPQAEKPQSLRIRTEQSPGKLADLTNKLRPGSDEMRPKREKVKKAKQREALDDFDSSPDEIERPVDPFGDQTADNRTGSRQGQQQQQLEPVERLSESPVQISPVGQVDVLDTDESNQPPGLVDDSSQEEREAEPASSPEFEDLGPEMRGMQQQMQPGPYSNQAFNPGNPAAPAPLSFGKKAMDPPQPTRMAPIPINTTAAQQQRSQSAAGGRSITPTSTLRSQRSDPMLNSNISSPPPLTSSPTSAPTSGTPTPTATTPNPGKNPLGSPPSLPAWSDASLRAYMEDTSHVRNLLLVINDTSSIVRLGPDDDKVLGMFGDERKEAKRLEKDLDRVLEGWIERKRRSTGGKLAQARIS